MSGPRPFSPATISDLFDISKSTLLRWEREGVLPPVKRDRSSRQGERAYTRADVRAIQQKQRAQLRRQLSHISEAAEKGEEDEEEALRNQREILETQSLHKFLAGNPTGLAELGEYQELMPETVRRLASVAVERYAPGDDDYAAIMAVVARQSRRLTGAAGRTGETEEG